MFFVLLRLFNDNCFFMKKISFKILWVSVLLTLVSLSHAQNVQYTLLSASNDGVCVKVTFPDYSLNNVQVNGEEMKILHMQDAYPLLKAGFPELLSSAASVIIPEGSRPTAEILSTDFQIVNQVKVAPSKGKLYRNVDPATVPSFKGAAYQEDSFLLEDSVALGEPYLLRDFYGVAVQVFPFAYNPVRQTLKVYKTITFKINFNCRQTIKQPQKIDKPFDAIYADHFLNYNFNSAKSNPLTEEGSILIITPEEFSSALQPYVEWKTRTGYPTTVVTLETIGNSSSAVKNYIRTYYEENHMAYVLLVGDNTKFPNIMAGGNVSDNYYGEIAGSDNYPDVIIGKISAETVAHVTTQVERFIQYEQNPPQTDHFPVFLGIASSEGPGDNNEYDYDHIRNIGNLLTSYTYTSGHELFEGSQGGLDASGDPTASMVAQKVNGGVGIINYCGHGSETSWVTSGFSVSGVNGLTNVGKLPFIISVACVNGDYSGRTCFAEAWMRATKDGQPTGAVSTLMSTINQPWESPMCAQDHMNQYLTGSNGKAQQYTFGGIVFNGFIKMLDNYNDYEVTRTWILFGDPTLMVRTAEPQQLPLTFNEICPLGVSNLTFNSTVENAKVIISKNNEAVASGKIQNGAVVLSISDLPVEVDTLTVLATASNYLPFEGQILRIPTDGPYVLCNGITFRDDQNNIPESGDFMILDLNVNNIGSQPAEVIKTRVYSDDPYISLYDNVHIINRLAAGESTTVTGSFFMQIAAATPAFHKAPITVEFINSNNDTTRSKYFLDICAPDIVVMSMQVDDSSVGNNNGKFDFGETVELVFTIANHGNGDAKAGNLKLFSYDERLNLNIQELATPVLSKNATSQLRVSATIDTSIHAPSMFGVRTRYSVHPYFASKIFVVKVGAEAESWESNSMSDYNWVTSSSNGWFIVDQGAYEGTYAARSGQIGNNTTSTLKITLNSEVSDSISFYYKVSSEADYDFLNFYIDNQKMESWSGNVSWTRAAFNVPAGQHTFKWEYKKDAYYSSGQDRAMIDLVEFPCTNGPVTVESYQTSDIAVSPNPTTQWIQIVSNEDLVAQNANYQLFDLTGRVLRQDLLTEMTQMVDIADFVPGIYILKIISGRQTVKTIKIVKQ